jgi:hypothetical protein
MPPLMDDSPALTEALTRRRFDIMVAQVKTMRWPFVVISSVMALLAARAVPPALVAVWLFSVLAAFVLRELWLSKQVANAAIPATQMVRGAIISNLAIGLGYGLSAGFMWVLDQTASAVLTTIAVSSAAGAVAISGTLPPVYLAYTLGIMIPFAAVWASNGTWLGVALAMLMGIFVTLQYRFARTATGGFRAVSRAGALNGLGHDGDPSGCGASPERMRACRRAISTAQRAQSAPLPCIRASAWSSSSVVRMPLAMGTPVVSCTSITARQLSLLTTSK